MSLKRLLVPPSGDGGRAANPIRSKSKLSF